MRKVLVLGALVMGLFATVPSYAECGGVGPAEGCVESGPDFVCSSSELLAIYHNACVTTDGATLKFFYYSVNLPGVAFVWGDGTAHGVAINVFAGPVCFNALVTDAPSFHPEVCHYG
jgi:hypothetical protein